MRNRAHELEVFLGDPMHVDGPFSYRRAVDADAAHLFPRAALDALHRWGYSSYQVPAADGGRLRSLEELVALGRSVAQRDPTVAVVANSPVASAMPVWLAGSVSQRKRVAQAVLAGQYVALGLTEPDHGADLLASEVTAQRTEGGYLVNGTKWLINNVRLARYICLLVREPELTGLRSLSVLLVDLAELPTSGYQVLERIPTHGIRGADIAGIRFHDAVVPHSAVIGRPGRGLELTARSLLVTRTLVPGLSLGALDAALRCTLDFVRRRHLYGGPAVDIPFVRDELAAAALDLRVAEVVTQCCVRALHLLPELAPVSSAVAKYVVPHVVEARIQALGTVLGARYFLAEDHWFGIFDKLVRDSRLFSLFDGSEPVVLSALAAQASCILEKDTDPRTADRVFEPDLGNRSYDDVFEPGRYDTVAERDAITAGLDEVCAALDGCSDDEQARRAAALLRTAGHQLRAQAAQPVDPRSISGQRLGERYARVFAAVCVGRAWQESAAGRLRPPPWIAPGLVSLLHPGARMSQHTGRLLFDELIRREEEHAAG